jgi:hypothetical protein
MRAATHPAVRLETAGFLSRCEAIVTEELSKIGYHVIDVNS